MVCVPTERVSRPKRARSTPPTSRSDAVPRTFDPSLKVTMPWGVPDPGDLALTTAVKMTISPNNDGRGEELRLRAVASGFTSSPKSADVLPANLLLPLYTAVIEWLPCERVAVLK